MMIKKNIKTVEMDIFTTSDEKVFERKIEAIEHEGLLRLIKQIHRNDLPRAFADRGTGYETILPGDKELIRFLKVSLEKWNEISREEIVIQDSTQ
tara:strand:- start:233 stop:517 length:285 start_codon:yes stop_codon:yes gene_type:complete